MGASPGQDAVECARGFIGLVLAPGAATIDDIARVKSLSDKLVLLGRTLPAIKETGRQDDEVGLVEPSVDAIRHRFAILEPFASENVRPWDDLHHTVIDLQHVVFLASEAGEDKAVHAFKYGFLTHWGMHLASLRIPLLQVLRTHVHDR
ncbi:hypothetical protein V0U79_01550 [Hyphobacterium sp. HN65]|uniref:DUF5063 domain-containing protein n=1 Tax=Hyphobacterium lacteum TaxID=3116575 RepID=A0ABU7LM76_9PROT|nr:hypothetical protein [Hyphobacterium sp. HN65]MEE2525033.1 hypothetical protein [Hyphobacterium sp. HN65]